MRYSHIAYYISGSLQLKEGKESVRGGNCGHGCQNEYKPGLPSAAFFYCIYVFSDVIGTCMQNFKNIERKKKQAFFICD